jgi:hypothetical protein
MSRSATSGLCSIAAGRMAGPDATWATTSMSSSKGKERDQGLAENAHVLRHQDADD